MSGRRQGGVQSGERQGKGQDGAISMPLPLKLSDPLTLRLMEP